MNILPTQTKRRLIQRYWRIFYYWSLNAIGEGIMDKKIKKEIDRIFDQANRKKRKYNLHLLLPFGLVCLLLAGLTISQIPVPPLQPLSSTDPENPVRPANFETRTTPEQDTQAISSGLKFAVGCSHWATKPIVPAPNYEQLTSKST